MWRQAHQFMSSLRLRGTEMGLAGFFESNKHISITLTLVFSRLLRKAEKYTFFAKL